MGGLSQPNGRGRGARALLEPRCGGTEGTEYLHISFKSSAGYVLIVYAFMYALLNEYLLCSEVNVIIYARSCAPGRTRTDTGRILSPPCETPGFQNCGILSVTQARVLGILGNVYQLCMSS